MKTVYNQLTAMCSDETQKINRVVLNKGDVQKAKDDLNEFLDEQGVGCKFSKPNWKMMSDHYQQLTFKLESERNEAREETLRLANFDAQTITDLEKKNEEDCDTFHLIVGRMVEEFKEVNANNEVAEALYRISIAQRDETIRKQEFEISKLQALYDFELSINKSLEIFVQDVNEAEMLNRDIPKVARAPKGWSVVEAENQPYLPFMVEEAANGNRDELTPLDI